MPLKPDSYKRGMIMKKLILSLFVLAVCMPASAQVTVYLKGRKKLDAAAISYRAGKLAVTMKSPDGTRAGATMKKDVSDVLRVVSPIPANVQKVLGAFERGKFDLVGSAQVTPLVEANRFLGWGKRIAFVQAFSMIKSGKTAEAKKLLKKARGFMRGGEDELDSQLIIIAQALADLKDGSSSKASMALKGIKESVELGAKCFYYNLQGDILVASNKKPLAVLAYYKSFLLDETNDYERNYAKSQIEGIYKEQNDPRLAKISNL